MASPSGHGRAVLMAVSPRNSTIDTPLLRSVGPSQDRVVHDRAGLSNLVMPCCPERQPIKEPQGALVPGLHDGAKFGRLVCGLGPLQHGADDRAAFALADYGGVEPDAHVQHVGVFGQSRNSRFGAEAHEPEELVGSSLGDGVVTIRGGDNVGELAVINGPRSLLTPLGGGHRLHGRHFTDDHVCSLLAPAHGSRLPSSVRCQ